MYVGYGAGRTGLTSISFYEVELSKELQKGADKYIFSGWVKHNGSPVTINVKLGNSLHNPFYNQNFTVTPTSPANTFEYFEFVIPTTQANSTFTVEINPVTTDLLFDDLAFYPSHGSLTTYTYKFPFGATSVSSGDRTSQTEYDNLGRLKYSKDKDGNILQKREYHFTEN
jgi:hypothetical protein